MPQYQLVDFGPNPTAEAAGKFGEGFSNRVVQNSQKQTEGDELGRILKNINSNTSGEDVIKQIYSSRSLPFDQKEKVTNAITGVRKAASDIYEKNRKKREAQKVVHGNIKTLKRQRELLNSGHLGPIFSFTGQGRDAGSTFTPAGQKARAEYERLGKSLIQAATNIPIRNRQEFETLAHNLFDPKVPKSEIEGTLDAMERILQNSLEDEEDKFEFSLKPRQSKTYTLRDKDGNYYDNIPEELYEQAISQGLRP